MKKIILLFALFASFIVSAQEDCDAIKPQELPSGGTGYQSSGLSGITFTKFKNEMYGDRYRVSVRYPGDLVTENPKGAVLFLENGKTIERPDVKVEVKESGESTILHTAAFDLTDAEVKLLQESKIINKRVYLFDKQVLVGDKLQEQFLCLVAK